ncbi:unnamed protein product [Polarella glacialis]|uniref:Uncharacterized protein n=1 Tax=Polarella glacialis TaxID=89957 RepID=A0A813LH75_POLGL|nr:unnamed protein product [Polarella glacialis]
MSIISIWLSVSLSVEASATMDLDLQPTRTNPRKRRGASEVDSTVIRGGLKQLLQTTSMVRTIKAAAITTVIFPTDHPVIAVAKACGTKFAQECKARAGAKSVFPPHITLFIYLIKTVSQDEKASAALVAACRKLLETPDTVSKIVSVCKISKTFDKNRTRLEIAVFPTSFQFLWECVDLWVSEGASEPLGPGPRGPLERAISDFLNNS